MAELVHGCYDSEGGRPFKCFLANLRVVFIRRPNPHKAGAYLTTLYGAPEGVAKTYKVLRILETGGFEYYELYFKDIRFHKAFRNFVDLFILSDNGEKRKARVSNHGAKPALRVPLIDLQVGKGITPK